MELVVIGVHQVLSECADAAGDFIHYLTLLGKGPENPLKWRILEGKRPVECPNWAAAALPQIY
jgi:hypothetical protein